MDSKENLIKRTLNKGRALAQKVFQLFLEDLKEEMARDNKEEKKRIWKGALSTYFPLAAYLITYYLLDMTLFTSIIITIVVLCISPFLTFAIWPYVNRVIKVN